MIEVPLKQFEIFVAAGVNDIPKRFRDRIRNIAFVVEQEPTAVHRCTARLRKNETLLGLYEGIPQPARGVEYGALVLPDRITIFKGPILREAESLEDVRRIVSETIWHEVAHHFGLGEGEVRRREKRRKRDMKCI